MSAAEMATSAYAGCPDDAAVLGDLAAIVGDRNLLADPAGMASYCVDWRGEFRGEALCVLRPGRVEEVAAIVKLCARSGLSIVPQGGNTGLAAGAIPDMAGRQVVVSMSRMDRIRTIDPIGMTAVVEAGCVLQKLQEAAAGARRMFATSLASGGSAQIGGLIATNAGGLNVLRYGMTRANVLGLEVVTADGLVVDGLRSLRKDNAGYDWKQVFIGSEGTLGIVTAAALRLVPLPGECVTVLLEVASAARALEVLAGLQEELGDLLNAAELISPTSVSLVREHFGEASPFAPDRWCLLVEVSASLRGLREHVEGAIAAAIEAGHADDAVIAQSQEQERRIWRLRELVTEAESKAGGSLKHDVSVPIAAIPRFLDEAEAAVRAISPDLRISVFGHLGDGNLHFNVVAPRADDKPPLNRAVHDVVVRLGGSISAEHGIGSYRVGELERLKPQTELELARRIRQALDPAQLFNPGKVFGMDGPQVSQPTWRTRVGLDLREYDPDCPDARSC